MYWLQVFDDDNKKVSFEIVANDSIATQEVLVLREKGAKIRCDAIETTRTSEDRMLNDIKKMGYEYSAESLLDYYKSILG
jgi:Zn finger protein HypA/HybF involved in hydrogenase expression